MQHKKKYIPVVILCGGNYMIKLEFDSIVFQKNKIFVAYSPILDVSSCGNSVDEARNNLKTAFRLFIEEAEKMGTLKDIMSESGYEKVAHGDWMAPQRIATEHMLVYS
jgi:predicted RNase H-like HicB family nuclease